MTEQVAARLIKPTSNVLKEMIENVNWDDVYAQQDANKTCQSFIQIFKTVLKCAFHLSNSIDKVLTHLGSLLDY